MSSIGPTNVLIHTSASISMQNRRIQSEKDSFRVCIGMPPPRSGKEYLICIGQETGHVQQYEKLYIEELRLSKNEISEDKKRSKKDQKQSFSTICAPGNTRAVRFVRRRNIASRERKNFAFQDRCQPHIHLSVPLPTTGPVYLFAARERRLKWKSGISSAVFLCTLEGRVEESVLQINNV
ncbi:hypothetical protein CDAR_496811 [Caerostris darwini]|uniref:Uncharacterized protein n=1 Tax=Caerostris darwini TaxID=1538125 RepID=A0AAV4U5B4_9ARAC|nr:hypothetical protein CDAR_496811 [Caerostris darwini]